MMISTGIKIFYFLLVSKAIGSSDGGTETSLVLPDKSHKLPQLTNFNQSPIPDKNQKHKPPSRRIQNLPQTPTIRRYKRPISQIKRRAHQFDKSIRTSSDEHRMRNRLRMISKRSIASTSHSDVSSSCQPKKSNKKPDLSHHIKKPKAPKEPTPNPKHHTPPTPNQSGGTLTKQEYESLSEPDQWLVLHQKIREGYHSSEMVWSDRLAQSALQVAQSCHWGHSGGPYGENIAAGYPTIKSVVKAWVYANDECEKYDPNRPIYSHFTQVVWNNSRELGCARVACENWDNHAYYSVCQYDPPGNVQGEFNQNVFVGGQDGGGSNCVKPDIEDWDTPES